jgi:hypothetical protein
MCIDFGLWRFSTISTISLLVLKVPIWLSMSRPPCAKKIETAVIVLLRTGSIHPVAFNVDWRYLLSFFACSRLQTILHTSGVCVDTNIPLTVHGFTSRRIAVREVYQWSAFLPSIPWESWWRASLKPKKLHFSPRAQKFQSYRTERWEAFYNFFLIKKHERYQGVETSVSLTLIFILVSM